MTQPNQPRPRAVHAAHIAIAAVALIVILLVTPNVWAFIEVPPNNQIFFQTSGRQTPITIGDFYTNLAGDNLNHRVELNIPCSPNQVFRIDLFDPEVYDAGPPGSPTERVDDEVRPQLPPTPGDQTSFSLFAPNNNLLFTSIYTGSLTTHNIWVVFFTINLPPFPTPGQDCGNFVIETWTGNDQTPGGVTDENNDDNAWKYRLLGDPLDPDPNALDPLEQFDAKFGPDNLPGTGDEAVVGIQRLSFQHTTTAAQSFFWFVDDGAPNWIGRNFDMDSGILFLCPTPSSCTVTYIAPSGATTPGTASGDGVWNNPIPPPRGQGDLFNNPEAGQWQADVVMPVNNQYIIEIESKSITIERDPLPNVIITKDDGVTLVRSPGVTTYTIVITNAGPGAAMPIVGPEVVDMLPSDMTYAGVCGVTPPLQLISCAETPPGSGTISFELDAQSAALRSDGTPFGPIFAYLPGISSTLMTTGTLQVVANINPGLADGTLLTNTAQVDWTDIRNNNYRPRSDDDTDFVQLALPALHVEKLTNGVDADDPNADPVPVIAPGDPVTWEYIVTNIGDVPLENITIVDNQGVIPIFVSGDTNNDGRLDLTETWLYRATGIAEDLANGNRPPSQCGPGGFTRPTYSNMGTATGTFSGTVVTDDDLSHYCNQLPGRLHVEKLTNGVDADDPNADPVPVIAPGDPVTWEYIVTNIGDVPLENIVIVDNQGVIPIFVSGDTNNDGRLDLTETWLYRATGVAEDLANGNRPPSQCGPGGSTRPTYSNMGTATGQFSQTVVTDDDLSHYCNQPPTGGCQVDCGGSPGDPSPGPTPAPSSPPPASPPVAQTNPAPVLPVQFLPETGAKAALQADKVAMGVTLLLVASVGIAFIIIRVRRGLNKKGHGS